jgi:hypothetical protein
VHLEDPFRFPSSQSGLRRREVLALPLSRVLPSFGTGRLAAVSPIAAGLAFTPRSAQAEPVTACLAVASAVAGLIAANNRSDGGMGAMMTATLEYQRVMAGQLASLQEGMAEVLTKLSALPKEFQALLHHDRLTQLHARLGREVLRYQHEATVRAGTFGSYQSWSADQLTRDEMTDVSRLVSDTVTEIKRGRWLDALTALYLPASVFAYLGVRSVLGEALAQQAAQAQRYLDLFDLIEDPAEPGSVAADLVAVAGEIQQRTRELAKMGFKVPGESDIAPQQVQVGRVAVQDYTPRTLVEQRTECRLVNPRNPDFGERCRDASTYTPERIGESETFGFFATVTPAFIEAQHGRGEKVALRNYVTTTDLTLKKVPNLQPEQLPTGPEGGVEGLAKFLGDAFLALTRSVTPAPELRTDARTTEARQAAARTTAQFKDAEAQRDRLNLTVEKLNQLLARSALDAAALAAVSSTRQSLFRYFGKGG